MNDTDTYMAYRYAPDEGDQLAADLYQLALTGIEYDEIQLMLEHGIVLYVPIKYVTPDGDWSLYNADQLRDLITHAYATHEQLHGQDESVAYRMASLCHMVDTGTDADIAHAYVAWQLGNDHG